MVNGDYGSLPERPALQVMAWRGTETGEFQRYEVPRRESQTVLDVVTYIQRHIDATLFYRFACRVGMCGSCAMMVNGIARWTCRTHVNEVAPDGRLQIAPLVHLSVVRDLVSEMEPFFDKWGKAKGQFEGSASRIDPVARVRPDTPERRAVDAAIECIGCAVCYASCDTVGWRSDYLGPAALNRAWTLINDARDTSRAERLRAVGREHGCLACHSHVSCSERCPKGIAPSAGIAGLKRACAMAALKGEL